MREKLLDIVLGAICLFIPVYLVSWIVVNNFAPSNDFIAESVDIIAINDTSEIHGRKYIFSGYVNENPAYWYYAKRDGYIKLESIQANLVLIDYTTGNPRIDTFDRKFKPDWLNNIFIATDNYAKIIRIPKGSITEDYTLDLEK